MHIFKTTLRFFQDQGAVNKMVFAPFPLIKSCAGLERNLIMWPWRAMAGHGVFAVDEALAFC